MKPFSFAGSYEWGTWWVRVWPGYGLMLKAPWSLTLFSERYGDRKFWPKRGWRIGLMPPT